MDGSIVPLSQDRPPRDSNLYRDYEEVIRSFRSLYENHSRRIVGVVKDSRSRRLMEILKDRIPMEVMTDSLDTNLLIHALRKGEATPSFPLTDEAKKHPVYRDLLPYSEKMVFSYVRAGAYDRPLRLEFMDGWDPRPSILFLSSINESYSYPSILIEVDLRAQIDPKYVERVRRRIMMSGLTDSLPLRRTSRPFR